MRRLLLGAILFCTLLFLSVGFAAAQDSTYTEMLQIAGRGFVHILQWSPDGNVLAVASDQGVWLYTDTLEDVKHLATTGEFDSVGRLSWSSDGRRIFAGGAMYRPISRYSNVAYAWDVETGDILFSLELEERAGVSSAAWQEGNALLALLIQEAEAATLAVVDGETGDYLLEQQYEERRFNNLAWSEDGTTLTVTEDTPDANAIITLDAASGDILDAVEVETPSGILSPDGSLSAVLIRNELLVQDAASGETLHSFVADAEIRMIRWDGAYWNHDGSKLVSYVQRRSRVVVFDVATGEIERELQFHREMIIGALDVKDNVLAVSFRFGGVELYDLNSGEQLARRWSDLGNVLSLAWNSDSTMIVTAGGGEPTVHIWDAQTGGEINAFDHQTYVYSAAWSPDGSMVAAGNQSPSEDDPPVVIVWDVETGEVMHTLPIEDSEVGDMIVGLEWSPDSRVLVATRPSNLSAITALRAWDVTTGELIFELDWHFGI